MWLWGILAAVAVYSGLCAVSPEEPMPYVGGYTDRYSRSVNGLVCAICVGVLVGHFA